MKDQHKLIKGYRDLSQEEIDLMNEIKALAEQVGELVKKLENKTTVDFSIASDNLDFVSDEREKDYDDCFDACGWVGAAKKDLQLGFMQLIRAVAKPSTF